MKKLFICQTPFQLIIALCIMEQKKNKLDQTDFILTNTFNGYIDVANKIRKLNIVDNVFTISTKADNKLKKILKFHYVFFTKHFLLKKVYNGSLKEYDEMYFWNYDSFSASLRTYFHKKNHNLKAYIFEEGYNSYFPYDKVVFPTLLMKIIDIKNKILHKNLTRESVNGIFLIEPNLLLETPQYPVFNIDKNILKTKEFKNKIKYIFNAEKAANKYDRKYIILEEYRPEYNDEEIFDKIIEKVGKENVIIKLHPRQPKNRFEKIGVKTLGSDGVPWEAIAFARDFSDKIIISISSSAVTSHRILFGENINAYLLFKALGINIENFNDKYSDFWNKLESKTEKGIHIPKTIEEFYGMIDAEKENKK